MTDAGGLIVDAYGGKYGGYSGGNVATDFFGAVPGSKFLSEKTGMGSAWAWGLAIVIVCLIILTLILNPWDMYGVSYRSGFRDHAGTRLGHASARSDGYGEPSETSIRLGGLQEGFRDQDAFAGIRSGFANSRETPYYSDVTNRVLRMENREKEAVRSLGKINQERLRRAAEDTQSTTPLPWGPFWKEWKQTHPIDGEPGYGFEGFEDLDPTKDLIAY